MKGNPYARGSDPDESKLMGQQVPTFLTYDSKRCLGAARRLAKRPFDYLDLAYLVFTEERTAGLFEHRAYEVSHSIRRRLTDLEEAGDIIVVGRAKGRRLYDFPYPPASVVSLVPQPPPRKRMVKRISPGPGDD